MIKLNLGSGPNKMEGFVSVDCRHFGEKEVDVLCNLGIDVWPWENNTITEAHCSHLIEHLEAMERVHFMNELYRVLKPGAKATIIAPHWGSCRAYGDVTHKWPPIGEMYFYYLAKEWRDANAPHNDFYTCDFDAVWGYSMHPAIQCRNQEYQQFAMGNYKEAIQDIHATITKKVK